MKRRTLLASGAAALTGCVGGGSAEPLQTIADNYEHDASREDIVETANRALEFHGVPRTEENRERIAELALDAADQDPNAEARDILVCMNGAPPDVPFESYTPNGWDAIEELAEACA